MNNQPNPDLDGIKSFTVYDPKKEGITADVYSKVKEIAPEVLGFLHLAIVRETSESRIGYVTLQDYLFNNNGFFDRNPDIQSVAFVDGKFHFAFNRFVEDSDLEKIMSETKSVPVIFNQPIQIG